MRDALGSEGLAELGDQVERVGLAVNRAISTASSEVERAAREVGRRAAAPRTTPLEPAPRPSARRRARARHDLDLLFGLLRITRDPSGQGRIRLLWGLIELRTRGVDGEPAALAPTARTASPPGTRSELLRAACLCGGAVACLLSVSAVLPGLWRGLLGISAIAIAALAAISLLSSFGDRIRGQERGRPSTRPEPDGRAVEMQALAASIAHEIRNPITAAKSLVQQMGEDPDSRENVGYAEVALEELARVERSVSHLLRFAKDEEVTLADVALADVVDDALAALAERAAAAGVRVERDLRAPGALRGDAEKLRRVVLNLVGNAIDALREGGTPEPRVDVQLGDNLAATEVWLLVRDNGPGISADARARIFTPFHSAKKGGTGLGLAITKKLVEAHGGAIEVGEASGGGAEFVVTLPKRRQPQSSA